MSGLEITNPSYEIGNAITVWLRLCRAVTDSKDLLEEVTVRLGDRGLRTAGRLRNRRVDHQRPRGHSGLLVGLDSIQVLRLGCQRDIVEVFWPFLGEPPVLVQIGAVHHRGTVFCSPVKPMQLDQLR